MMQFLGKFRGRLTLLLCVSLTGVALAAEPTANDIVQQCEYKNAGPDNTSLLSITLIDKDGSERKNVYRRLWKNYRDAGGEVADKMVLMTEFPPDARGTGFLRWGYLATSGKMADQWLYLPHLRKIRRVSVRDPGDSFLGSDLTYGDIDDRPATADTHTLLRVENLGGQPHYVVESVPKEANSLYSKRVSWYAKGQNWAGCVRQKTEYFDRQGMLLKTASLKWQQVGNAWAWERVQVENVQTHHKSLFEVADVKVGVGLEDRQFTERELQKGG